MVCDSPSKKGSEWSNPVPHENQNPYRTDSNDPAVSIRENQPFVTAFAQLHIGPVFFWGPTQAFPIWFGLLHPINL